jgi:Rrf2 family protein
MDLKLSTSLTYGLTALGYLAANHTERPVMMREICHECKLPYDSTMKVMRQLTRARLVNAHRGSKGGFTLRMPANEISFLRIIEAIEGPIETGDRTDGNHLQPICRSAIIVLNDARSAVEHVYGKLTLKDLAAAQN